MKTPPLFITGTGTGVGKTTLTALLTLHLRCHGVHAVAIKPYCSGSREDTKLLASVNDHELTSEQITPVFCPKPLAPRAGLSASASRAGFRKAIQSIEETSKNVECLLIEGIGGLEVPLAPGIAVSDLISITQSNAIIAGRNRLGVINEVSLTQYRLQEKIGKIGQIVLMQEQKLDESASSNARILAEKFKIPRIILIPHFNGEMSQMRHLKDSKKKIKKMLARILKSANIFSGGSMKRKIFGEKALTLTDSGVNSVRD